MVEKWAPGRRMMEMMVGCCVRETSGGKRMEGDGAGDGEPGVCVQIWERFCVWVVFFLDGLGCFKLRGIRPGLGER